jgi:hypothetical protein
MQWTIENPNGYPFVITSWTIDGGPAQPGFTAPPGSTKFTTTQAGTHTLTLYYGDFQSISKTFTLDSCPFPIPSVTSGLLIPVTGADQSQSLSNGFFFGGFALGGLGLILSALRKLLGL